MFYVYVYRDPRPTKNNQPVYVGKGQGSRSHAHWIRGSKNKGFNNWMNLLRRAGLEPIIERVSEFPTEQEAHTEEMRLIAAYGRRDLKTGTLFNLTDGGEGLAGVVRTDEWNANMSAAHSTPERRSANSLAASARWAKPEYRKVVTAAIRRAISDPDTIRKREAGKSISHRTPEFREKMRQHARERWDSVSYRAVVTAAMKAGHTPEVLAKKAEISTRTWADEEVRRKRTEGIKAGRSTAASREKTRVQGTMQWADEEYRARQTANNKEIASREEVKAAKAAALKARWADPVKRAELLAARAAKKAAKQKE